MSERDWAAKKAYAVCEFVTGCCREMDAPCVDCAVIVAALREAEKRGAEQERQRIIPIHRGHIEKGREDSHTYGRAQGRREGLEDVLALLFAAAGIETPSPDEWAERVRALLPEARRGKYDDWFARGLADPEVKAAYDAETEQPEGDTTTPQGEP